MKDYIVSMTSWKGRIKDAGPSIFSFLTQTIKPKKIILNLSAAEFSSMDALPADIRLLSKAYFPFFEINWIPGKTPRHSKKLFLQFSDINIMIMPYLLAMMICYIYPIMPNLCYHYLKRILEIILRQELGEDMFMAMP